MGNNMTPADWAAAAGVGARALDEALDAYSDMAAAVTRMIENCVTGDAQTIVIQDSRIFDVLVHVACRVAAAVPGDDVPTLHDLMLRYGRQSAAAGAEG